MDSYFQVDKFHILESHFISYIKKNNKLYLITIIFVILVIFVDILYKKCYSYRNSLSWIIDKKKLK